RLHMLSTGEWGEFFPPNLSPVAYNQSDLVFYLPTSKEKALAAGFRWADEITPASVEFSSLPDHIRDAGDELLGKTFECVLTGKPYRIIKQELEYYRRNNIPIPRSAPLERIKQRLQFFNLHPLKSGACESCGQKFETVFLAGERPLLCEDCFQNSMY